jgi:hypothetical protein
LLVLLESALSQQLIRNGLDKRMPREPLNHPTLATYLPILPAMSFFKIVLFLGFLFRFERAYPGGWILFNQGRRRVVPQTLTGAFAIGLVDDTGEYQVAL